MTYYTEREERELNSALTWIRQNAQNLSDLIDAGDPPGNLPAELLTDIQDLKRRLDEIESQRLSTPAGRSPGPITYVTSGGYGAGSGSSLDQPIVHASGDGYGAGNDSTASHDFVGGVSGLPPDSSYPWPGSKGGPGKTQRLRPDDSVNES